MDRSLKLTSSSTNSLSPGVTPICQKCFKSQQARLLSCGGCRRAYYCNTECQRSDWSFHKKRCLMMQQARKELKTDPFDVLPGFSKADAVAIVKKWVQRHKFALYSIVFNALTLHTTPEKGQTHILLVTLAPSSKFSKNPNDLPRSFLLEDACVISIQDLVDDYKRHLGFSKYEDGSTLADNLREAFSQLGEKSRERLNKKGDMGYAALVVRMPIAGIIQISPLGWKNGWREAAEPEWKERLRRGVDEGVWPASTILGHWGYEIWQRSRTSV